MGEGGEEFVLGGAGGFELGAGVLEPFRTGPGVRSGWFEVWRGPRREVSSFVLVGEVGDDDAMGAAVITFERGDGEANGEGSGFFEEEGDMARGGLPGGEHGEDVFSLGFIDTGKEIGGDEFFQGHLEHFGEAFVAIEDDALGIAGDGTLGHAFDELAVGLLGRPLRE